MTRPLELRIDSDTEVSCKCIEQAIAENRSGVVLQIDGLHGANYLTL